MVVYGLALGNQRQLNGGDFSTGTDELWPVRDARQSLAGGPTQIDPMPTFVSVGFAADR
jgi:hypothetical protein